MGMFKIQMVLFPDQNQPTPALIASSMGFTTEVHICCIYVFECPGALCSLNPGPNTYLYTRCHMIIITFVIDNIVPNRVGTRGGSTGSRTGCNLKTGCCCMIAFPSHRLYLGLHLDHAYLYLRLYLRGTVQYLLAYCLVNPKNWSLWWKLRGTAVKKPQVWSPLSLYRHVIISFMTFWPCRTSSG